MPIRRMRRLTLIPLPGALVSFALVALASTSANAQSGTPVVLFIESMRAPGYGSLDASSCEQHDLECIAAAAENTGTVPPQLLSDFKGRFSPGVRFVGSAVAEARKVVGGIVRFRQAAPDTAPQCEASGFVSPDRETGIVTVRLDDRWGPPFGKGAAEGVRRDRATSQCLGGLGAKMSEQLR